MDAATLGVVASFGSSVTWTIGSTVYSQLTHKYPAHTVNFVRAVVALPFFLLLSALFSLYENRIPLTSLLDVTRDNFFWLVVSNISSYAFGDILFYASSRMVGVPTALAIASTFPLFAALAGWGFENQAMSAARLAGVLVTITGTALVVVADNMARKKNNTHSPHYFKGVLLAFAAALSWSLNAYSAAKGGSGISAFDANIVRMTCSLFLVPAIGIVVEKKLKLTMTREDFKASLPVVILESVGGSCFYLYGMSHAPLAVGATLCSLAPVLSLPIAVWKGRERFSYRKTLGVLLVILGVWLLV